MTHGLEHSGGLIKRVGSVRVLRAAPAKHVHYQRSERRRREEGRLLNSPAEGAKSVPFIRTGKPYPVSPTILDIELHWIYDRLHNVTIYVDKDALTLAQFRQLHSGNFQNLRFSKRHQDA
jgi:hypothetical protein